MKKITKILFTLVMITALSFSLVSAAFADSTMESFTSFEEWWNSSETVKMDYEYDEAAAQAAWDAAHPISSGESGSATTEESTTTPMGSFTSFSEWWAAMSDTEKASSYGNDESTAKAAWDAAHPTSTPTSSTYSLNIALKDATLGAKDAFVSSYSATKGDKVIAYNIILTDSNGNVSNGNATGKYNMSVDIGSVRVYNISDTSFSTDLSSLYSITTSGATLTRTATYTGSTSGSSTSSNSSTTNGTYTSGTTSSTTSVKTGDENNIGLWVAISVIALAGVSASVVMIRRKASK